MSYTQVVANARAVFNSGRTKSLAWRKQQLKGLVRMLEVEVDSIHKALYSDLHKSRMEALHMEIFATCNDIRNILAHLDDWAKPERVKKNLVTLPDDCYIRSEPLGVALVMGAWNYPISLLFMPLSGAIAAGNCAVIKPSEISAETAKIIEELVPRYLDPECFPVINGGVPETQVLLQESFDHIFYTGGATAAKSIMAAAAKHLTPVTLELGGKSPAFVDRSSDLEISAQRLAWGKWLNCGQTCVAPDYILCEPDIRDELVDKIRSTVTKFYGDDPKGSECYGRIINQRHYNRLQKLMESGQIVIGGVTDEKERFIAPTVMVDVQPSDAIMQEEIFGPLLPILTVSGPAEAVEFINAREKPLTMYIFSKNKRVTKQLIENTSCGGVCVNDTIMHMALDTLPFGGVGKSGMGRYHGKYSFDTFSHKRSVMVKKQNMEAINTLRYPPYTERKSAILDYAMQPSALGSWKICHALIVIFGLVFAVLLHDLM